MIERRPFRVEDLDLVEWQAQDADLRALPWDVLAAFPAWTALEADEVLWCAGVVPFEDDLAEAWALVSRDAVRARPFVVARNLRDWLVELAREVGLVAVTAHVPGTLPVGRARFIRWLGFEPHGACRFDGQGQHFERRVA